MTTISNCKGWGLGLALALGVALSSHTVTATSYGHHNAHGKHHVKHHNKYNRWKRGASLRPAIDINPDPNIFETTLVASEYEMATGPGQKATVFAYNNSVPGPLISVMEGDRVIVHLENDLPTGWNTSIHWHGIEGTNAADGTPVTQLAVKKGETYTYDFVVPRAGTFWYHPHLRSTQAVFSGLYGALVVTSPHERALVQNGVLPRKAVTLLLSDMTIDDNGEVRNLEGMLSDLETMNGTEGEVLLVNGRELPTLKLRKGQGVRLRLINSSISRYYRLSLPGHKIVRYGGEGGLLNESRLEGGVQPAMVMDMPMKMCMNDMTCATNGSAYSQCMDMNGMKMCGAMDMQDTGYDSGEILLAPAERVTVVIVPNAGAGRELFLEWKDFARGRHKMEMEMPKRMCMNKNACTNPEFPTCMRMNMAMNDGMDMAEMSMDDMPMDDMPMDDMPMDDMPMDDMPMDDMPSMSMCGAMSDADDDGARASKKIVRISVHRSHRRHKHQPYSFEPGTPLLTSLGEPVEVLGAANVDFSGMMSRVNLQGSMDENGTRFAIDGVSWKLMFGTETMPDPDPDPAPTARHVNIGDTIKFEVHNHTNMHHPFHLHGFSFQPIEFREMHHGEGTMKSWPYGTDEFVDTVSIPPHTSFIAKVRIDDPLGGNLAVGRWLFHCHIFQHGERGMISELIVSPMADGGPVDGGSGMGDGGMDMGDGGMDMGHMDGGSH